MSPVSAAQPAVHLPSRTPLSRRFYVYMCLPIVAAVVYGFSFTIGKNFLHPAIPRPRLLYVHGAVMALWLAFFALQAVLVQVRKTRWHLALGWFGIGLAAVVWVVGIATAIVMTRFDLLRLHQEFTDYDFMFPLWDMLCFGATTALAVYYRRKPEYHRRLMFVATCAITAAGWGRFPQPFIANYFYAGVDLLILMGVASDWMRTRSVHVVYKCVLPIFIVFQTVITWTWLTHQPYWRPIARALLGM